MSSTIVEDALLDAIDLFTEEVPGLFATLGGPDPNVDDTFEVFPVPEYRSTDFPYRVPDGPHRDDEHELSKFILDVNELYITYGPQGGGTAASVPGYGIHAEVGDDHVSYTHSAVQFLAELAVSRDLLNVKISEKDTFVSEAYGNYSESFILKPENISEAWQTADVFYNKDLPFLDTAKIRTLLPVSSMRQKHSDTLEGKVALHARLAQFATPSVASRMKLSTAIQVVTLDLMRERKFPFLPDYLGGLGCQVIGGARDFCRMVNQFKSGRYSGLIYSITERVLSVNSGDMRGLFFLSAVNQVTQQWRTWYNFYSRYVPAISGELPLDMVPYQVGKMGRGNPTWDNAADRLRGMRGLVSEADLLVHHRNAELTRALVSSETFPEFQERLEMEKEAQRSITICSKSFTDVWNDRITLVNEEPTLDGVEVTLSLTQRGARDLKSYLKHDLLYRVEAIDHIYTKGPLKVSLQMEFGGTPYPVYLEPDFPDDVIQHREDLLTWVLNPRGQPPEYYLEDDPIILAHCREFSQDTRSLVGRVPVVFLQTEDIRLCVLINKTTGLPVVHVGTHATEQEMDDEIFQLHETHPQIIVRKFVDSGAMMASGYRQIEGRKIVRREILREMFPRRLITVASNRRSPIVRIYDEGRRMPTSGPRTRGVRRLLPFKYGKKLIKNPFK